MSYSAYDHEQSSRLLLKSIAAWPDTVQRTELPYILTNSGRRYYHADPRPEDVCIEDVVHALSRLNRFTGHLDCPLYSVAQHSWYVSVLCAPEDALDGLLHDAREAYVGDVATPLKRAPGMEVYQYYEELSAVVVARAFNIAHPTPPSVKRADTTVGLMEMRDLFHVPQPREWAEARAKELDITLRDFRIKPWTQQMSAARFLMRYEQLTNNGEWRKALRDTKY